MIDINYKGILWGFLIALVMSGMVILMVVNAGCITAGKNTIKELTKTPEPTPTPIPTPIPAVPTPIPTPAGLQTIAPKPVDPYTPGERWESQWFKWRRLDVEGLKDLEAGIIVYRHGFLDYYTWYNNAMGNYQVQEPSEGNRYFVVWVHEEILNVNKSAVTSMWIFDETAFRVQVKDQLYSADTTHNPVNRIREFDHQYDYYDTVIAGPFAWDIRYSGFNPETAGYVATRRGWLRMGQGNSVDGYILFEIPEKTMEEDILLLGSFSQFGSAYWRFTT